MDVIIVNKKITHQGVKYYEIMYSMKYKEVLQFKIFYFVFLKKS